MLRAGLMTNHPSLVALALALFMAAGGAVVCGTWRAHQLRSPARAAAPPTALMVVTVAVALLACAAALVSMVVTPH